MTRRLGMGSEGWYVHDRLRLSNSVSPAAVSHHLSARKRNILRWMRGEEQITHLGPVYVQDDQEE